MKSGTTEGIIGSDDQNIDFSIVIDIGIDQLGFRTVGPIPDRCRYPIFILSAQAFVEQERQEEKDV